MGDERCPACGRALVPTMAEFWKNPSYSCPSDVPRTECNDSSWLELYCAQGRIAQLESALRAADELRGWQTTAPPRVVEAYDEERAKVTF